MRVLITGGAGYIGSVLCKTLLEKGFEVTVLDNFFHGQTSLLDCCGDEKFQIVKGDCRDEELVKKLLKDKDIVIPLAALVGAPLCNLDKTAAVTVNYEAVRLLCRLASPSQKILFPVTNSGYGIGEKGKMCTEDSPLKPLSLYGETKVKAEQVVLDRGNAISFRLATVFGVSPRMRLDLLVNDFVHRAVMDKAVVLFEGHFKRNYIHVRDVVKVFLHGIEKFDSMKDKPYNVGLEDANLSKVELCQEIQKQLPQFVYMEAPIGEDPDKRDYIVSNQRILATGYRPDWGLARGIKELIKCYTILKRSVYGNV
ncbi:MAG: NAD(P)-dependent oxidoreductase [Deltaproteobacteria bacterium]|nr:NAD(P)-dependent oxidoreductase [Deltaproteobacteria bacterium]